MLKTFDRCKHGKVEATSVLTYLLENTNTNTISVVNTFDTANTTYRLFELDKLTMKSVN